MNTATSGPLAPSHLLAPPAPVCAIPFDTVTDLHVSGQAQVRVTRAGTVHGVCGGIVTSLVDRVEISNLPGDPGTSNFAHAFLPIDTPVPVAEGDGIDDRRRHLRWRRAAVDRDDHRRELGCDAAASRTPPFSRGRSRARGCASATRTIGRRSAARAEIERDLLNHIDGTRTVADLEQWLAGQAAAGSHASASPQLLTTTIERCG